MIIGLAGKKQVGKSTAADHLRRTHAYSMGSFAAPLKELCRRAYGLSRAQTDGSEDAKSSVVEKIQRHGPGIFGLPERESPWTARQVMQYVGTDLYRAENPDHWVDLAMDGVTGGDNITFPDVRFENEARAILQRGGIVVGITRDNGLVADGHSSEALDLEVVSTFILSNDGTEPEFLADLDHCLFGIPGEDL